VIITVLAIMVVVWHDRGWKEYTFHFSDFKLDGSGLMAIFIGAVTEEGPFKLTIDNVRLK
jgi:hypothetical protein